MDLIIPYLSIVGGEKSLLLSHVLAAGCGCDVVRCEGVRVGRWEESDWPALA